jgi:ADP-heptose:LPS heptosyltransferase
MKILVVQLNRIGDLILLTPMLKILKEKYPESELHFLTGRRNYDVAADHPLIDKTYMYKKDPISVFKLIVRLRLNRYDIWIDPRDHESSEGNFLARMVNAKVKIGFNAPGSKAFTHSMKSDSELSGFHYTTRAMTALDHLDINSADNKPVLYVTSDSEDYVSKFLSGSLIKNYYCLNISANGPDRYWQTEKWIKFITSIDTKSNEIVLISLPDDISSAEHIKEKCRNVHVFMSRSIIDIFSLISRSEMVITVDTSIVHIASAFNKPILALYVNLQNFYSQYSPISENYRVVMSPKDGDPISEIAVADVINKYVSLQLALPPSSTE